MGSYVGTKAAEWARKNYCVKNPADMPPWGYRPNNDCTNFVSGALYAGGWEMTTPNSDEIPNNARFDLDYWYVAPDINNCLFSGHRLSHAWTAAPDLAIFALYRSKRAKVLFSGIGMTLKELLTLEPGDVMQTRDETDNDALTGAMNVTHTAIVVQSASPTLLHKKEQDFPFEFADMNNMDTSFGILAQHQNDFLRPLTRWLVRFKKQSIFVWRPQRSYAALPPNTRLIRPSQAPPPPPTHWERGPKF